jgi:hypothetical protein
MRWSMPLACSGERPVRSVSITRVQRGVAVDQLARHAGLAGQALGTLMGFGAAVAACCTRAPRAGCRQWVSNSATAAREFTRDGQGAATQLAGNCPQAAIVVEHDLHQRSFLKAQVVVRVGHAADSPQRRCCTWSLSAGYPFYLNSYSK